MMIHIGDCREEMMKIEPDSVDAIITDPPYEIGFMNKQWDRTGVAYQLMTWLACYRVLKPGGHLLAFGGSRTYHRIAVAIEDSGFDIRDTIMWLYGSGFPKSHNLDGGWSGWGTALKPAHEPIIVARKPFKGTVEKNVIKYGTGALNIDGCRVGTDILPEQRAGQAKLGTFEREDMVTPERVGRWPANVIHDGSEEVVSGFPDNVKGIVGAKACGKVQFMDKHDQKGSIGGFADTGSAARFFYCAKASKLDREEGLEDLPTGILNRTNPGGIENDPKWAPRERKNIHPTVKPTDLMRYLCRLVTPPGGLILDPFTGSGSTGKAAILEGFRFVGIEMNPEYRDIAEARIAHAASKIASI
jgi:site-specific DNA-methyltransferase (adenine-specific)